MKRISPGAKRRQPAKTGRGVVCQAKAQESQPASIAPEDQKHLRVAMTLLDVAREYLSHDMVGVDIALEHLAKAHDSLTRLYDPRQPVESVTEKTGDSYTSHPRTKGKGPLYAEDVAAVQRIIEKSDRFNLSAIKDLGGHGTQFALSNGAVVDCYDNGKVYIQGRNIEAVRLYLSTKLEDWEEVGPKHEDL